MKLPTGLTCGGSGARCTERRVRRRDKALADGLVDQHRASSNVAGSEDVRSTRAELAVDLNVSASVRLHARPVKVQAIGGRYPPDGHHCQGGFDVALTVCR